MNKHTMKIYHTADIHLGKIRMDGKLPDSDFADALKDIVLSAIDDNADVFLITGDLFDNAQISPPELSQAMECLQPLKDAGIPVLAVEGNHDKISLNSTSMSWVRYLSGAGYLRLLSVPFTAEGPVYTPWNEDDMSGSFIEINGVRFIGAGYMGAGTPKRMADLLKCYEFDKPTVVMLHAGQDYFVGELGGFDRKELKNWHDKITYLALGHIHKPLMHEDWACNPGSPENCRMSEISYDTDKHGNTRPRGYAVIEIDKTKYDKPVSIICRSNTRRKIFQFELDCTPFGNKIKAGAEAVKQALEKLLTENKLPENAVVQLFLTGSMNIKRIHLDYDALTNELEKQFSLLALEINREKLEIYTGKKSSDSDEGKTLSRKEMEINAIMNHIPASLLTGLEDKIDDFANLFYHLKEMVNNNRNPQEIFETICNAPVTGEFFGKQVELDKEQ